MKKINVAELLRNCPNGMELDSPVWDNIVFEEIDKNDIIIYRKSRDAKVHLTQYGEVNTIDGKCVIFPKGKTTWEGFVPPCKFKDGDIVATGNGIWIGIVKKPVNYAYETYVTINGESLMYDAPIFCFERFATEEEKEKLFQAIKNNGYRWDDETKKLIRLVLPKFHKDDWIIDKQGFVYQIKNVVENVTNHTFGYDIVGGGYFNDNSDVCLWTIQDAKDGDVLFHSDSASNGIFIFKERGAMQKVICHCDYDSEDGFCLGENHTCCWADSKILHPATQKQRDLLFSKMKEVGYKWNAETKTLEKLFEPKFKVGDRIKYKTHIEQENVVAEIKDTHYILDDGTALPFVFQDEYELVPNKFDITTLKPFDKVLMRSSNAREWVATFYSHYNDNKFYGCGMCCDQCIPYEGNEHLLGTTNDCDDFYKNWK